MTKIPDPRDCLGNIVTKDALFVLQVDYPLVFRVSAVESGGIHTANGITPALVRLFCDITMRQVPGLPFRNLIKAVDPSSQALLDIASSRLPL